MPLMLIRLFVLILCCLPLTAWAEEAVPEPEATFPDVSQIVPESARLELELEELRTLIERMNDTATIKTATTDIGKERQQIASTITRKDPLDEWSAGRLMDLDIQLKKGLNRLDEPLKNLTEQLKQLATAQQNWQDKQAYWQRWRKALRSQSTGTSTEGLNRADTTIRIALKLLKKTIAGLSDIQQKVSDLQVQLNVWKGQLGGVQAERRKGLFERNDVPMFNHRYARQLQPSLLKTAVTNARERLKFTPEFWQQQWWLFALQILVIVAISRFIALRRATVTADDWQFFMRHPIATSIFIGFLGFMPIYRTPTLLFEHIYAAVIALSGSLLISSLLKNPIKIVAVFLVTVTGILTFSLTVLSFPQPLFRLYIAIISLTGATLVFWIARRQAATEQVDRGAFLWQLRLGGALLLVALVAQLSGYTVLANRLVEAGVSTFILIMVTLMLYRLIRGGVEGLVRRFQRAGIAFFQHYGDDFQTKICFITKMLLSFGVFWALLPIWGISEAAEGLIAPILSWGISTEDLQLTVGMILSAAGVLYLAFFLSWVLQGLWDVTSAKRQHLDRGLRDSIKRLLHYLIIFTSFLVAMNLAGVEIRHFAVIAGALGIGIGFGLQTIVNNFISGLILLFERPVKVGDMILLDGEYGNIRNIGLRSTVVATLDQAEVIVPNSMLVSEKVINWTLTNPMARVRLPVGVAYGSDVTKVLEALMAAAQHPKVMEHPGPSALFTGFGDSSLDFELQFWIPSAHDRLMIKSEIGQQVDQLFREAGIEIPFPQRDLHIRSITPQSGISASIVPPKE